jgi:hypothetical protein
VATTHTSHLSRLAPIAIGLLVALAILLLPAAPAPASDGPRFGLSQQKQVRVASKPRKTLLSAGFEKG